MGRILLCADRESLMRPWMMGLDGIDVETLSWLIPVSDALEARKILKAYKDTDEAWLVSCERFSVLNLAAALRKDNAYLKIVLVLSEATGSLVSKAKAAGISSIATIADFAEMFARESARRRQAEPILGNAQGALAGNMESQGENLGNHGISGAGAGFNGSSASVVQDVSPSPVPVKIGAHEAVGTGTVEKAAADESINRAVEEFKRRSKARGNLRGGMHDPFILSVVSGSGGSGKSSFCAIVGYLVASRGLKTLILDCDLQFGDLLYMTGIKSAPSVDSILSDPERIATDSENLPAGKPYLISAPERLENAEILANHIGLLLEECSNYFDFIVVNTGSAWEECHASLLERSTCTLFLIDQRASSIHSLKHALDLCMRLGIATTTFMYAINRCEKRALFSAFDIASVTHGIESLELKDGGVEVEELLGAGKAAELAATKNSYTLSIRHALVEIVKAYGGHLKKNATAAAQFDIPEENLGLPDITPKHRLFGKSRSESRATKKKHARRDGTGHNPRKNKPDAQGQIQVPETTVGSGVPINPGTASSYGQTAFGPQAIPAWTVPMGAAQAMAQSVAAPMAAVPMAASPAGMPAGMVGQAYPSASAGRAALGGASPDASKLYGVSGPVPPAGAVPVAQTAAFAPVGAAAAGGQTAIGKESNWQSGMEWL